MSETDQFKSKLDYLLGKFNNLINTISEEDLNMQIQDIEGGWTALEILRHIAVSEQEIVDLIHKVISGNEGVSKDFDLRRANERNRRNHQSYDLAKIKQIMNKSRESTLNLLEHLSKEDWEMSGRYFTGDTMTTFRMFEILMWHQSHHLKQIINKISK